MIWLVPPNTTVFLSHGVHTHAGSWSLAQPPSPHLQLGHASSTTLKKPTPTPTSQRETEAWASPARNPAGRAGEDGVSSNGLE